MNDLERYFSGNRGRLVHKWHHYFEIYDDHFRRFRDKDVVVVEIGVFHGGSLQMWKNYFGERAKIYGIDINPRVKELEEENIEIIIGSQSDRAFLRKLKEQLSFGGGHKRPGTFIEYSKNFVDYLHGYHSEERSLPVSQFTRTVSSLHFYDSMLVIQKKITRVPYDMKTGHQVSHLSK